MVEWSPSVSIGSLIKNKLCKCFSTVVNLGEFLFLWLWNAQWALSLDAGQWAGRQGAPAWQLFLPLQLARSGPYNCSSALGPATLQA